MSRIPVSRNIVKLVLWKRVDDVVPELSEQENSSSKLETNYKSFKILGVTKNCAKVSIERAAAFAEVCLMQSVPLAAPNPYRLSRLTKLKDY